jgi:amidase
MAYADVSTVRRRHYRSEALLEGLLERIAALDAPGSPTALRSILAVSPTALDEAAASDRRDPVGPLHGIPVLIKDNVEVAG